MKHNVFERVNDAFHKGFTLGIVAGLAITTLGSIILYTTGVLC